MAYSKEERIEIINRICAHISEKKDSLRNALKLKGMPDKNQFYKWINDNEEFREQYARACNDRADSIFEEMLEIADDGRNDFMTKSLGDGVDVEALNAEHIQRSRLRIDARKWMLSKMNPKKYGDKIHQEHSGDLGITWKEEKSYEK